MQEATHNSGIPPWVTNYGENFNGASIGGLNRRRENALLRLRPPFLLHPMRFTALHKGLLCEPWNVACPRAPHGFGPMSSRASVQKSLRLEDRRHHGLAASAKKSPSSWRMLLSHVTTAEPGCRLSVLNKAFVKMLQTFSRSFPFIRRR